MYMKGWKTGKSIGKKNKNGKWRKIKGNEKKIDTWKKKIRALMLRNYGNWTLRLKILKLQKFENKTWNFDLQELNTQANVKKSVTQAYTCSK